MGHRVKKGGSTTENGDIMLGGRWGDRFMQRIKGRRSFTHIHERNSKTLGGDEAEERKILCHGNFEGTV